ncbi:hypothetical protein R3P38DRAFT_15889 [Favolaschia claudopus]|uniref:Proteophosphoglycan ppg4 n=1 Tax=Favolaschia claudopus TaxID=2862362 RepID=A0AAW0EGJ1_9AGAR
MLIKLTPPSSPSPTPTILFALVFADPPAHLPLPPAWAAQLARLAADDLEAPPTLHALDRAAAFPSLLSEVLFDLPRGRIFCSFLDGAMEEWELGPRCAQMLSCVIQDVEESGRAEERAREWQQAIEAERARMEKQVSESEKERDRVEREREAELERAYEEKMQNLRDKGKGKTQSLNSPPASLKGAARPKGRLHRSRSLLMALVASFSSPSSSSSSSKAPASAPPTRTCYSDASPRAPSPLRAFARRASFTSLSVHARTDSTSTSISVRSDSPPPSPTQPPRARSFTASPPPPSSASEDPFQNLATPPGSAPPSAPSSAFSTQQTRARPRHEELGPRALRRRARSTLVDAFRLHVLPALGTRVGLFESAGASLLPLSSSSEDHEYFGTLEHDLSRDRGGGYHAWVARSMLRRAEARMRELEGQWPTLVTPAHRHGHKHEASGGSDVLSPLSVSFPSPVSPRETTFEPWSSSESEDDSETESETEGASEVDSLPGGFGEDNDDDDSDGSSVHTPESGHSIGYGHPGRRSGSSHVQDVSTSSTSSYFTCADDEEADDGVNNEKQTNSNMRSAAHRHRRNASDRLIRREERERRRVEKAARAEHMAFVRMTARLRRVLVHGEAARSLVRMQRAEGERVREGRGVRRAWLDKKGGGAAVPAQAFRPTGLRAVWDAEDAAREADMMESSFVNERPPPYEDIMPPPVRRSRPSPPIHRTAVQALAHLDELEREDTDLEDALDDLNIDVDLVEHLDLTDALDIEGMALVVDGDLDEDDDGVPVDVFADVGHGGKGRAVRGRRVPVPLVKGKVQGMREVWERRRVAAA